MPPIRARKPLLPGDDHLVVAENLIIVIIVNIDVRQLTHFPRTAQAEVTVELIVLNEEVEH